jgi:hypothetical protein
MRRFDSSHVTQYSERGPLFIGIGLAIVLLAHLWPAIPIAAAIGLVGLGATQTLSAGARHELLLPLNGLMYVALVALAVAAQFEMRSGAVAMADALGAGGLTALSCSQCRDRWSRS